MNASRNAEASERRLDASNAAQRRTLQWVLALNLAQVLLAGTAGFLADSTA